MHDRQFELEIDKWTELMQEELNQEEDEQSMVQMHIYDILDEAGRWGMRQEVYDSAQEYMNSGEIIDAYNLAIRFLLRNRVSRGNTTPSQIREGVFISTGWPGSGLAAGRIVLRKVHTGFTSPLSGFGPDVISW